MCAQWISGRITITPAVLVRRLESFRPVDNEGKATFTSAEYEDCTTVLTTALSFSDLVPASEKARLLRRGLLAAAARGPLTTDGVLRSVTEAESEFLRTAEQPHVLLAPLSAHRGA
jgi:hypothetical protein